MTAPDLGPEGRAGGTQSQPRCGGNHTGMVGSAQRTWPPSRGPRSQTGSVCARCVPGRVQGRSSSDSPLGPRGLRSSGRCRRRALQRVLKSSLRPCSALGEFPSVVTTMDALEMLWAGRGLAWGRGFRAAHGLGLQVCVPAGRRTWWAGREMHWDVPLQGGSEPGEAATVPSEAGFQGPRGNLGDRWHPWRSPGWLPPGCLALEPLVLGSHRVSIVDASSLPVPVSVLQGPKAVRTLPKAGGDRAPRPKTTSSGPPRRPPAPPCAEVTTR